MDVGQGKQEERPVFYGNTTEIVEAVCEMRQINGPCLIKLLADSGKGAFKISLSIMPEDFEADESNGQRTSYSEGSVGHELSLNGVKRIILVAHVPDVKESWENCKALWDLAEINQISYLLVADIKLTLTVLGLQTASSMFPCPYCFISLKELRGLTDIDKPDDGKVQDLIFGERTFGKLKEDHQKLQENNIKSHSTVKPSILN